VTEADRLLVHTKRNTARFFTENRHVAWVALLATLAWGIYGYHRMPKAKDPTLELRIAAAICLWPGVEAKKVEAQITRKIEAKLAESPSVERIESISRTGGAVIYIVLKDELPDRVKEWDAIQGRLEMIHDLPAGAGPIEFERDFGDTATLVLTVASPKTSDIELELRAAAVAKAITATRASAPPGPRAALVLSFPGGTDAALWRRIGDRARAYFDALPHTRDARLIEHGSFFAIDVATELDDGALTAALHAFTERQLQASELHPDLWDVAIVRAPASAKAQLTAVAGERYSYRQLDDYTDQIQRTLAQLPIVGRVTRTGVLPERVYLDYSQAHLAASGVQAGQLGHVVGAHAAALPGGVIEQDGKNVTVAPSGELTTEQQIGDIIVATSPAGVPVYLRDLVDIDRSYESPPRFLTYLLRRTPTGLDGGDLRPAGSTSEGGWGSFERSRAITVAVTMRRGGQIGDFEHDVDAALAKLRRVLPEDLIFERTSDQPRQVRENVHLFLRSLVEAIALVVIVALLGFWEWRTALLLTLSIPITLAMTFGLMWVCGIDIQQISIASLIISLGLLIDDPVVASDAIRSSLADGWSARTAAWLGPTKLATAILFATVTNIAAYLPFLTLTGDVGIFIRSLPIVLTLSLISSRIVSMTFVPLLGAELLRAARRPSRSRVDLRDRRFGRMYRRLVGWAIAHRFVALGLAIVLLVAATLAARDVQIAFFPKDESYLCYIDVRLPEDATLAATRAKAVEVERVIQSTIASWAVAHHRDAPVLRSITEFDGGGGPRFWFSVSPELVQLNYAQLVVQVEDKSDTRELVPVLQAAVTRQIADARVDVRELETGEPVGVPISFRISGDNLEQLRRVAAAVAAILRATPGAERVRDDWGAETFAIQLDVDSDRANLASVTNLDVAASSAVALNGAVVGQMRDGDHQIPIIVRMRGDERAQLADLQNLYVHSATAAHKVPVGELARPAYALQPEQIRRRNQVRTITVAAFPAAGHLSSEIVAAARPQIDALAEHLPAAYRLETGGELEELIKNFRRMLVVFVMMMVAIYLALVAQFRHALKPLVVFATLPFGAAAGVLALVVMGAPLSFMALLGIGSLMGVIVSHIIVLFDFIEEKAHHGAPVREALLDAGLIRLRPVLITVVATVLGLVPLALHGGPLWQPLCYAQIGGLVVATLLTLVLVPVLYTVAIEDLKLIRWHAARPEDPIAERLSNQPTLLMFDPSKRRRSAR
jgi:multidrug efflux pump subunit AcrB